MNLLLVEPWFAGSHAAWANGLCSASSNDIRLATLPGEFWRTRLRSGAAELVPVIESVVEDGWMPDVLLVTGMVDVATLAGLLGRSLGSPPIVVYQHESQIVYPNQSGALDVAGSMHNVNSWLVADEVWFNSDYHRQGVLAALSRHGDELGIVASRAAIDALSRRSQVMPVGVDLSWVKRSRERSQAGVAAPRILWPHRWDWDKRPDVFLRALRKLALFTDDFRLVLVGDDGAQSHVRDEIESEFSDQVDAVGPLSTADYRRWVAASDVVVSCAEHEFFGIGVVEALAAGCVGVLPNDLSYPGIVGRSGSAALYDGHTFGGALRAAVAGLQGASDSPLGPFRDIADTTRRFDWSVVGPSYDAALDAVRTGVNPSH